MKIKELRKIIREVISEQLETSWAQVPPIIETGDQAQTGIGVGISAGASTHYIFRCPDGYKFGPSQYGLMSNPTSGGGIEYYATNPQWGEHAISTGCIPKNVDVAPQKDDGKPGRKPPPSGMTGKDPLGDTPVGGGVFGTANLGDLPSS